MIHINHILKITLIVILSLGNAANSTGSEKPTLMEKTITAISNCIAGSPAPWSNEWQSEYMDTIRKVIESHQNNPVLV